MGTYAFMVPRTSLRQLMLGYQYDMLSQAKTLSPDLSMYTHAADHGGRIYVTVPLQCYHHSGFSSTWGRFRGGNITGYEHWGKESCSHWTSSIALCLMATNLFTIAVLTALYWRYRFLFKHNYMSVVSHDDDA